MTGAAFKLSASFPCDRVLAHIPGRLCRSMDSPRCEDRTPTPIAAVHVNGTTIEFAGTQPVAPLNPYAPKLTVEQRREAVRMVRDGQSMTSVARHFGVRPNSIENLVRKGRYVGKDVAHTAPAGNTTVPADTYAPSSGVASRTGVDLIIRGLPLENYKTLEESADAAGWSLADFVRELLACAAPPSPIRRPIRVGLRHLISTWRTES